MSSGLCGYREIDLRGNRFPFCKFALKFGFILLCMRINLLDEFFGLNSPKTLQLGVVKEGTRVLWVGSGLSFFMIGEVFPISCFINEMLAVTSMHL